MYYDLENLVSAVERGESVRYVFFYGHGPSNGEQACFSQFFKVNFVDIHGVRYNCAEQFMMASKAKMFEDKEAYDLIMELTDPLAMKKAGRKVRNFSPTIWAKYCRQLVCLGNEMKFGQNPNLRKILEKTGSRILVEASPRDQIWGIGMGANNPACLDPRNWNGKNYLGFELTRVRDNLCNSMSTNERVGCHNMPR